MVHRVASGGFGVNVPILFPFKSKISTAFMLALDAYNRPLARIYRQVFEAILASPFGYYPFRKKLPI